MMKSEKGVTLTVLAITIILMFILVAIGVNVTNMNMGSVKDNRLKTELGMVRQAITEQYLMAKAVNQIKIPASNPKVSFWLGERLQTASTIQLPAKNNVVETEEINYFYDRIGNYNCEYQEDYYYRLNPEELKEIGIKDSKDTYIVNYKTGEVYNETIQKYSQGELLYLSPIPNNEAEQTEDTTSFNDWSEKENT